MAEIRINATGGVKLYDADDSHYAQILAGTISSNVDALTLGSSSADFNIPVKVLGTTPTLTIGDAGAEDTKIVFDGNAQDFYIALDDSADDLLIGLGSTVGTTPAISINSDRDVTISDGAIDFDIASHDTSNGLKLGGTLVTATAAELNIMDGVTSTATEINLIDGGTSRGTTAVASGDGILINDGGTMRMTNVDTVSTYFAGHSVGGTNIATVGTIGTGTWQGTAIASSYIAADAITGAKIADDAIDSEHYTDGSIDLAHMSSESVDEDNLHISNAGTNGQFLSKQSGNSGGLTWDDAGSSTTHLAVGTYAALFYQSTTAVAPGATVAGSDLKYISGSNYNTWQVSEANGSGTAASGTWRSMSQAKLYKAGNDPRPTGLWCRTA